MSDLSHSSTPSLEKRKFLVLHIQVDISIRRSSSRLGSRITKQMCTRLSMFFLETVSWLLLLHRADMAKTAGNHTSTAQLDDAGNRSYPGGFPLKKIDPVPPFVHSRKLTPIWKREENVVDRSRTVIMLDSRKPNVSTDISYVTTRRGLRITQMVKTMRTVRTDALLLPYS